MMTNNMPRIHYEDDEKKNQQLEECNVCFERKGLICQYYNHRVCFQCWETVVKEHIFQELGLAELFD